MNATLQNILTRFPALQPVTKLPKPVLMAIGAGAAALVLAGSLYMRGPDYKVLFSNVSDKDGGAIVSALDKLNIPHQFSSNGGAILVPEANVHSARMKLAEQGLPQGGNVGFELMENPKFGASQFAEQVTYQRAVEGELARSVEAMYSVSSARVHLATPKQTLFVRDRKAPTASVLITLAPGRTLGDGQVAAIAWLVASSVPDLTAENISIVDQTGRLLSSRSNTGGLGSNDSHVKFTAELEERTAARVLSILTPIVGAGNVHTEVSAQVDFNQREQTSETYRPNQKPELAAVRSEQTNDAAQHGMTPARGVPGSLTNQPPPDATAPVVNAPPAGGANANNTNGQAAGQGPSTENRSATINYELDRTVSHTKESVGQLKRLSVAVVVNYRNDEEGNPQPLTEEQLEQIREIVREAIGYSEARGDSLRVANTPFNDVEIKLPIWKDPDLIDLAKMLAKYLMYALAALFAWFKIIKPLIATRTAPEADDVELVSPTPVATTQEQAETAASRYAKNLESAIEIAKQDPRAAAMALRGWLAQTDESK